MKNHEEYDIDFDIDLDDDAEDNIADPVKTQGDKDDTSAFNFEEELERERKRHETTKEKLFEQQDEIENLKSRIKKLEHLESIRVPSKKNLNYNASASDTQAQRIALLEEELRFSLGSAEDVRALKAKSINLIERIRNEKREKARVEADVRSLSKKIDILTVHIEKIMIHLKHEAAAKIKAMDALRGSENRNIKLRERNDVLARRASAKDRLVHELREGSKILEDQLRLMDEKYLELRSKLDYSRQESARRVEKAERKARDLRVKYALLGNSKVLDAVDQPVTERQDIGCNEAISSSSSDAPNLKNTGSPTIHRGSMKRKGPKIKRMNMTPGYKQGQDKDAQEQAVIDKIRKNRGQKTIWTEEKLRNLCPKY